jgi:large subunit ribosomal protein L21
MNTYAIVEAGGEQIRVEPGRFYDIRLNLPFDESSKEKKILFSRILMIRNDNDILIGNPWLTNAIVKGRISHYRRGSKIVVYNMRPKKHTAKKRAHRQTLIRFIVDAICLNNKSIVH